MIRVSLTRDRLSVTGHAESSTRGEDVVCAAVSAVTQTLLVGLRDVVGIPVHAPSYQPGSLQAEWNADDLGPGGDTLIRSVLASLKEIEKKHGDFVEVKWT